LSICAADKRYYLGDRDQATLKKKLPMALIHEAVGTVLDDPSGHYKRGQKVVLLPNTPFQHDDVILENYLPSSHFRSSGYDGFMQSVVVMRSDCVLPYYKADPQSMVMAELLSVAVQSLRHFSTVSHQRRQRIGIWGSGNVGFVTSLAIHKEYPDSEIYLFGVNQQQMEYFSFVDHTCMVSEIPDDLRVDHAFECVGGAAAGKVINQIIDHIQPMGTINLMGVSNEPVGINTRMVLEKGLTLAGTSRSGHQDFEKSISLIDDNTDVQQYLNTIISQLVEVREIKDLYGAFNASLALPFKVVMKWNI
jgi:ribitol-5-phosphate 2-dehydrogenase